MAKDAQIGELEGKVASAAKTAEATEVLNAEIAAFKRQMATERVDFALKAADARSLKATKVLLEEYDGDAAALMAAEPWLLEGAEGPLHKTVHKIPWAARWAWSLRASRAAPMRATCAAGSATPDSLMRARRANLWSTTSQMLRTKRPSWTGCISARRPRQRLTLTRTWHGLGAMPGRSWSGDPRDRPGRQQPQCGLQDRFHHLRLETKTFNYDRGIKLLTDVTAVEEAGVLD